MSEENTKKIRISDVIDASQIEFGVFNLISSGCGTGKTWFCVNDLCPSLNIPPSEVLFVTSRALTVDQLVTKEGLVKFRWDDLEIVKYWNGEGRSDLLEEYQDSPLVAMTYDKLVGILTHMGSRGRTALGYIKAVVFDECHCLVSDSFIQDIEVVKFWLRDMVVRGEKYIIGLTATPEMVIDHMNIRDIPIRALNEDPLIRYRAKRLKCIAGKQVEDLLTNGELLGKTLVMCRSVDQCEKLCEVIPNSTMLVSKGNQKGKCDHDKMDPIRWHIVNYEELPLTIPGTDQPLNVLIATSTIREGFNLVEASNIRNVICYYVDEMNITQLVGRCRYDIDCLIIADAGQWDTKGKNDYQEKYIKMYRDFIDNGTSDWFKSISHIVSCKFSDIERGITVNERRDAIRKKNERAFIKYLDEKGLIFRDNQTGARRFQKVEKDEIIEEARRLKLFSGKCSPSKYTWNMIVDLLSQLGYEVRDGSSTKDEKPYRYKEIWKIKREK